jgi:hypothetical protein
MARVPCYPDTMPTLDAIGRTRTDRTSGCPRRPRARRFAATIAVGAGLVALCGVAGAQSGCDIVSAKAPPPFSRAENADGARFVWVALGQAGFPFEYVPASAFPRHAGFRLVAAGAARAGDVAWWPSFSAIYGGPESGYVVSADGQLALAALVSRYGPVRYYRRVVPADLPSPDSMGRVNATAGAGYVASFLLPDGVRVDVPCGWHLLEERETDSVVSLALNVPNAVTDPGGDRTSVLIVVHRRTPRGDFRAFTDTLFASLAQGTGRVTILADTMPDAATRFVLWRAQKGSSAYTLYDHFGRRGATTVHVRIAMPVAGARGEWMTAFSGDTERLLAGLRVQQTALFLGWAARPSLSKFRP